MADSVAPITGAESIPVWKRIFDLLVAGLGLLVLALPLLLLALLIWALIGRPVFFRQCRLGLDAKPFNVIKFRTMRDARCENGHLLPDAERMTVLGRFLRATSLDELPELWNILRGDMSVVGPRPLLPEYLPYYSENQARRHSVRPGLTGLAQVNGRNAQTWDKRLELDTLYVDSLSLWLDIQILFRTVRSVVSRDGISADGHETMPRFDDQVRSGKAKGRDPVEREQ